MLPYYDPTCHVRTLQNEDLAREAARVRLITAATRPAPVATPRPLGRLRAGLRQAVAALVALAPIG